MSGRRELGLGRESALLASKKFRDPRREGGGVNSASRATVSLRWKTTHFQTTTFSAGAYFALPTATLHSTRVVLSGVGIRRTMPLALSLPSKLVRREIVYSTLDLPTSLTIVCNLNGRFMFVVERYLVIRGRRQSRGTSEGARLELTA